MTAARVAGVPSDGRCNARGRDDLVQCWLMLATSPRPAWLSRRYLIGSATLSWATGLVLLVVFSRHDLAKEYFFDEAWRADIIRSAHPLARMRRINTAIPPLWPVLLHLSSRLMPSGFRSLRMQSLALSATFPAMVGLIGEAGWVRHAGDRASPRSTLIAGMVAAIVVCVVGNSINIVAYLNDYLTQAATVAMFVAAWVLADEELISPTWIAGAGMLLGVGTLSGMFVIPGLLVLAWPRRRDRLGRTTLAALGLAVTLAGMLYLTLYRRQVDDGLRVFWAPELLRQGTHSLVQMGPYFVRSMARLVVVYTDRPTLSLLLGLVVLALAIVGMVATWAKNRWLGCLTLSGIVVTVLASVVAEWPVTAVRVNLPVIWLVALSCGFGAWTVFRRLGSGFAGPLAVLALTALLALQVHTYVSSSVQPFARGLHRDLDVIRASTADHVVVVGYHFMSEPYIDDGVFNEAADPQRFQFLYERGDDSSSVYESLGASLAARNLAAGTEVWCVIPFEIGSDAADRACRLDPSRYEFFYREWRSRALLIGARVRS